MKVSWNQFQEATRGTATFDTLKMLLFESIFTFALFCPVVGDAARSAHPITAQQ